VDEFMTAAIEEAEAGLREGGIPIGSVLVHHGRIVGRGHNRRVQRGSSILHGEMDALENAGRLSASTYRECTLYTTLSPCAMCSGAILLYGIPRVVIGENVTFQGEEGLLLGRGAAAGAAGSTLHRAHAGLHRHPAGAVERGHRRVGSSPPRTESECISTKS
jgi:cytosine/creatinine deaminase